MMFALLIVSIGDAQSFEPVLGTQTIRYQFGGEKRQAIVLLENGKPALNNQSIVNITNHNDIWFDKRYKWSCISLTEADSTLFSLLVEYFNENPNQLDVQTANFAHLRDFIKDNVCRYGNPDDSLANVFIANRQLDKTELSKLRPGLYAFFPYAPISDCACFPDDELFGGVLFGTITHTQESKQRKGLQGRLPTAVASLAKNDSTIIARLDAMSKHDAQADAYLLQLGEKLDSLQSSVTDEKKRAKKERQLILDQLEKMSNDSCCDELKGELKKLQSLMQPDKALHRMIIQGGFGFQLPSGSDYNDVLPVADITIGVFPFKGLDNLGFGGSFLAGNYANHIPIPMPEANGYVGYDYRDKSAKFADYWGWRGNLLWKTNKEQFIFLAGFGQNQSTVAEVIRERNALTSSGAVIDWTERPSDDYVTRTDLACRLGFTFKATPTINVGLMADGSWSGDGWQYSVPALQKPKYSYPQGFHVQQVFFIVQFKLFNY